MKRTIPSLLLASFLCLALAAASSAHLAFNGGRSFAPGSIVQFGHLSIEDADGRFRVGTLGGGLNRMGLNDPRHADSGPAPVTWNEDSNHKLRVS